MTLYELTGEYKRLMDDYEVAETDEERERILHELLSVETDTVTKCETIAKIIKDKEAARDAKKAEAKRLTDSAKIDDNTIDRLKGYVLDTMQELDLKDIQTAIGKWRIQKNPASCTILNDAEVPEEFHIHQPDKFDKRAILDHFKQTGEILPGTEISQSMGIRFR